MTQARPSRIGVPAAILIAAAGLLLFSIGRLHVRRAAGLPTPPPVVRPIDPVGALEARVAQAPRDGAAWHALAAQYFDAGRYGDATRAYTRAVALLPKSAILRSALGEARVLASPRDPMPAAALDEFRRAIAIDPKDPRARYFLAVSRDLGGDHRGAIEDWLRLLADTPPGAAWQSDLRRTIEQVGRINAIAVAPEVAAAERQAASRAAGPRPAPLAGPSAEELQAAAALAPDQQRRMADDMVSRLDGRLRAEPRDPDGWLLLIRSRMTLGQPAAALATLDRAVAANPAEAAELRRQAAALGVRSSGTP